MPNCTRHLPRQAVCRLCTAAVCLLLLCAVPQHALASFTNDPCVAQCFGSGPEDIPAIISRDALQVLAEDGNPQAQFTLGCVREAQCGNSKYKCLTMLPWYEKAAAQGHAGAQYALGALLQSGAYQVPSNAARAAQLYQQAAAQGNDKAQLALGWMYKTGHGIPRDERKAAELFQAAAQHNQDVALALEGMQRSMWRIWFDIVVYFIGWTVVLLLLMAALAWLIRLTRCLQSRIVTIPITLFLCLALLGIILLVPYEGFQLLWGPAYMASYTIRITLLLGTLISTLIAAGISESVGKRTGKELFRKQ